MADSWIHDAIISFDLTVIWVLEWRKSETSITVILDASITDKNEADEEVVDCRPVLLLLIPRVGMRVVCVICKVDSLPVCAIS